MRSFWKKSTNKTLTLIPLVKPLVIPEAYAYCTYYSETMAGLAQYLNTNHIKKEDILFIGIDASNEKRPCCALLIDRSGEMR